MKQFAVIGLGRFGMSVAQALIKKGMQVLAIDKDSKKVEDASEFVTRALQLDATDKDDLKNTGVEDIDVAIVGVGEVASSILITLILKELGLKRVISRARSPLQGKILEKIGAERVIYPEQEMGERLAESLISPEILEYIKLSPEHTLIEIDVPENFEDKTLRELAIRDRYGVQVVAIKRQVTQTDREGKVVFNEDVIIAPSGRDGLIAGDKLIVLGENKNIEKIKRLSSKKE